MTKTRIAIIGAGIGGLTTALALTRAGMRCDIYEQSGSLPGRGGGIQLAPNAMAVLRGLGVDPAPTRPVARELRRWRTNEVIGRVALGPAAELRFGAPYGTIRRAALCRALYDALPARMVQCGRRVIDVRDGVLHFADGSRSYADAVIGADGLHSVIRGLLHADSVRYSGHSAYRAVIPADRARWLAAPPRVVVWLGPGRHCVSYPIDGGRNLNLVATVPAPVPPSAAREVSACELLAAYPGWHPAVRGLFAVADRLDQHGLFDRPPLPAWHRGRIAVLGDAAHPMLPFIAQGAAQAIEDAAVLAACIGAADGFARYEAIRRPRVERVAAAARAGLHEHHLADGPEQQLRDSRLSAAGLPDLDWLYGAGHQPGMAA